MCRFAISKDPQIAGLIREGDAIGFGKVLRPVRS
jgi:hypothetical protein